MTRVPELMAAGITVALGHDCVMDPWYGWARPTCWRWRTWACMSAQMTSREAMRACFEAVTDERRRKVMGLEGYGLAAGLPRRPRAAAGARSVEAIRLRATRLKVYRKGMLLAQTPAATASLHLPGRADSTAWMIPPLNDTRRRGPQGSGATARHMWTFDR